MFSKFESLSQEKQERIMNAAMQEFAKKGYKNASTDLIVKDAGISKGALFHYFKNKLNLYWYLYDYAVEQTNKGIFEKVCPTEGDLLKRIRNIVWSKMELTKSYPQIFAFFLSSNLEDWPEISLELERRNRERIKDSYQKILLDVDYSKFRSDIDIDRAIEVIIWTVDGFTQKQQQYVLLHKENYDYEGGLREFDHYLQLLGNCLYHESWEM